jgi:hypothetical protein
MVSPLLKAPLQRAHYSVLRFTVFVLEVVVLVARMALIVLTSSFKTFTLLPTIS